jgi:hypothetical protein
MAKLKTNIQFEENLKAWIIEQSELMGVSMSGFVNMAVSQYKQQQEALTTMQDMGAVIQKLTELENKMLSK